MKQQEFLSSGTFTPSPELIEKGGWVNVYLVGGGGAGGGCSAQWSAPNGNTLGPSGGYGGAQFWRRLQINGPVAVTIGAGGVGTTSYGPAGGNTSFGARAVARGGPGGDLAGYIAQPRIPGPLLGAEAGERGFAYGQPGRGGDSRGLGGALGGQSAQANTGAGGGGANWGNETSNLGGSGGSGYVLVTWEE